MPRRISEPRRGSTLDRLAAVSLDDQKAAGYAFTLAEILQQPELWVTTATQVSELLDYISPGAVGAGGVVLTGSGSSFYVGETIRYAVQEGCGVPTVARTSGELLLLGDRATLPARPLQVVSFARSGNSPESTAVIRMLLEGGPDVHHLILTCNQTGRVVREWANGTRDPMVRVVTLDDRTCDRSLVMTSSFTNLVVAGLGLSMPRQPAAYVALARALAQAGSELLDRWADPLAEAAQASFDRLIVLGDGGSYGAAREAALKMLEMTEGRVITLAETTLGFRHGPMAALHRDSLVLMFLSSDPMRRAYQLDVVDEVRRKELGGRIIAVGANISGAPFTEQDLAVDLPGLSGIPDDWAAILHVVVGQLLGFFRCRAEGLHPDQPASNGAISRVVPEFTIHGALAKVPR